MANDGRELGVVGSIQSENLMVDYGPIAPDHVLVPKSSVKDFDQGVVHLNKDSKFVEDHYRLE
ncbi:hypothetical protein BH18THE2_BH18THE2_30050 [soil metagenome]